MVKKKPTAPPAPAPRPIPPLRTWEVTTASGPIETVQAHDCDTYHKGLNFNRIDGDDDQGEREWVAVRGFNDAEWKTYRLVDPVPPPPDGVH